MSDLYLTLGSAGEGIVREKMSRFLAFAIPVDSPETSISYTFLLDFDFKSSL